MLPNATVDAQRERWQRLSELIDRINRYGLSTLSTADLFEYGRLYRRAVSDLSLARAYGLDERTIDFLNRLVGRAYGHLYRTESKGFPSIPNFFVREFPQAFRRNFRFIGAAILFFAVSSTFGFVVTVDNPDNVAIFGINPGMLEGLAQRHTADGGKAPDFIPSQWRPIASSGIMTNNIMVSFIAFAGGIIACIGTVFILLHNGLFLGVVAAAITRQGGAVAKNFWAFVAPHGVIEIPAIFIAAGAGLVLGYALINPGEHTRRDALKLAGREAIKLILGVVAMLVIAGIIEGFVSPAPEIPEEIKFLFAAIAFTALCAYLGLSGLERKVNSDQLSVISKQSIKITDH